MAEANESKVLTSPRTVKALHYSRSRHPRWRDEAGKEVVPRVDLGRFGFFRGDRNWLILMTEGEPIILSVEDPQLRIVLDALQTRTGLTVQRFR